MIHTCIKEDNPKYYEAVSKSFYKMKKEFDQNNAKILYPPMVVHKERDGKYLIQPIHWICYSRCYEKIDLANAFIYKVKQNKESNLAAGNLADDNTIQDTIGYTCNYLISIPTFRIYH
jgi:hypothetical protein